MEDFLKSLNLLIITSINLPVDKLDFINILYNNLDQGSTNIFASALDIFSSGKNDYIGSIESNRFKLRKRRRLFDMNMSLASAEGIIEETESGIHITLKTNGFSGAMIPFYAFTLIFYIGFTLSFLFSENASFVFIPFICFHATLMLGIPYLIMRRGAKRMAHDLERDLFYMTRDAHKALNR